MAKRPEDFGDRFPDDNDSPPIDRTAGYDEIDYKIETPKPIEQPGIPNFSPERGVESIVDPGRETFTGIVLKKLNTNLYEVILHDGRIIEATDLRLDLYEDHFPSDKVNITIGNTENEFFITDKGREFELTVLDLQLSSRRCSVVSFVVPFDIINTQTPPDKTFTREDPSVELQLPGTIKVNQSALYEINFDLTLESGSDQDGGGSLTICDLCPVDELEDVDCVTTDKFVFDRRVGFNVYRNIEDNSGFVTLESNIFDSVLNMRYPDAHPVWTDTPRFGGDVIIGTDVEKGWITWGNKFNDETKIQRLTRGENKAYWIMPDDIPSPDSGGGISSCSFMVAERVDASERAVQFGWEPFGRTGFAAFDDFNGDEIVIVVSNGLIQSITKAGSEQLQPGDNCFGSPISIPENEPMIHDPCDLFGGGGYVAFEEAEYD